MCFLPDAYSRWIRYGRKYPGLYLYISFSFTSAKTVKITTTYVLLDETGENYDTFPLGSTTTYDSPKEESIAVGVIEFDFATENKVIGSGNLNGHGVNCVCIFTVE